MWNLKNILVPLDLHEEADNEILIAAAVEMAKNFSARLIFVNVVDVDLDSAMVDRFNDIKANFASQAQKSLAAIIDDKVPSELPREIKVASGRSYSTIINAAEELRADLIMVAAHKAGMKEFLLGMTAARVVRHANCSVMVVRTR